MGFDITFHPISKPELHYFCFEPIQNPELAIARVAQITNNQEDQHYLMTLIYQKIPDITAKIISQTNDNYGQLAFCCAAIAGYLHPFWYARGGCISFLAQQSEHFSQYLESIQDLAPEYFEGLQRDDNRLISQNYQGGGYVDYSKLEALQADLHSQQYQELVEQYLGSDNLLSLTQAIAYCLQNQAGFLEATDIYVPIAGETPCNPNHLRATYLNNINDFSNARGMNQQ